MNEGEDGSMERGDPVFEKVPEKIAGGSLDSPKVVDVLIENIIDEYLRASATREGVELTAAISRIVREYALILLGRSRTWIPEKGWNEAGMIDTWLASILKIDERNPIERVKIALVNLLAEVAEIAYLSTDPSVHEDQWRGGLNVIKLRWRDILMGLDDGSDDLEDAEALADDTGSPAIITEGLSARQRKILEAWKDYP